MGGLEVISLQSFVNGWHVITSDAFMSAEFYFVILDGNVLIIVILAVSVSLKLFSLKRRKLSEVLHPTSVSLFNI